MRYKRATIVLESASGRGFILPKDYRAYGLVYRRDLDRVRATLLKLLLTVAERIAES